jgi:hypothetical protein
MSTEEESSETESALLPLRPALGPPDFRTVLALAMVVVAALGAIVADHTAKVELTSATDERRLDQGQMLELQYRQTQLDLGEKRKEFDRRRDELVSEATLAKGAAEQAREKGDLHAAAALELRGEEKSLRARIYRPFSRVLPDMGDNAGLSEDALIKRILPRLQSLGFKVNSSGPDAPATAATKAGTTASEAREHAGSIWQSELGDILRSHRMSPSLAWEVFVFVVALFFFVLADLFGANRGVAAACATIGFLTGIGCALYVAINVLELRSLMLWIPVGAFLAGLAAWRFGLLRWIAGGRHHIDPLHPGILEYHGAHMSAREADDTLSRGTVVLLAATVILSAWAGYGYSCASAKMNEATLDGFGEQVEMIKRSTRSTAQVLRDFDAMAGLLEHRVECAALEQEIALVEKEQMEGDQAELRARKDIACTPADAAPYEAARKALDGPTGIDADAYFPYTYMNDSVSREGNNATEAFGRWDGNTEIALFWSGKATSFLRILTLCAIALFFLGQSLAIGRTRLAWVLVICAIGFAGWATWSTVETSRRSSEDLTAAVPAECRVPLLPDPRQTPVNVAAYSFAEGKRIVDNADNGTDLRMAVAPLRCAVKARPDFALARFYYAMARALQDSPQAGQSYWSMPNPETLEEVVRNRKAAIDSLSTSGYVAPSSSLNSYGASLWHFGVVKGHLEAVDESITQYQASIDARQRETGGDPQAHDLHLTGPQLLPYLNTGLSYLTKLDFNTAGTWFNNALQAGAGDSRNWDLITNQLTTFEILEANCRTLHSADQCARLKDEIARVKAGLVSGKLDPTPAAGANPAIADPEATVSADILEWSLRFTNFNPSKDKLLVVWYVSDALPRKTGSDTQLFAPWRTLSDLGGPVDVEKHAPDTSGRRVFRESYLASNDNAACLVGGKYRAEFYVNESLTLRHEFPMRFDHYDVTRWHDLDLSLCHPAGWRPWQKPKKDSSGLFDLVEGLQTETGAPAVFGFTFFSPAELAKKESRETFFLEQALQYLHDAGVLKGTERPHLAAVDATCAQSLPAGDLVQKAWATQAGWVHVALIFADALPAGQACDVARSIYDM